MFGKVLVTLATLLVVPVVGFANFVAARQNPTFDAPSPRVAASAGS